MQVWGFEIITGKGYMDMTVGIIGAGTWGKNLVRTFFDLGRLAAIAETNPDTREFLARQYPAVPIYADYKRLLETDVQAIVIAAPVNIHYDLAKESLLNGKDVFVEKPLALSYSEAEELVNIAVIRKRMLMAGHLLLYQPAIQFIKRQIESGVLGEIAFLTLERLNLGRVRQVENVLWSLGVHDIAVLLYLIGQKPQHMQVSGQCIIQKEIEDDVFLHLVFPNNIAAHLHVSWLWPERRRYLTVVGTEAMLTYDEIQQQIILHKKGIASDMLNRDYGSEVVFQSSEEPLMLECRHFLDCMAYRQKPLSDGRSALDVIDVLNRADNMLKKAKSRNKYNIKQE